MIHTLKPYPVYRHANVDWLSQVPAHWEVMRLQHVARLNPSKSEAKSFGDGAIAVFLPMERVGTDGRCDCSDIRTVNELWHGYTYFRRGDVIVAKITPCFENGKGACLTDLVTEIGFGSTEFHVLRPLGKITSRFLYRITTLPEFRRRGEDAMTGAAGQQRIPASFIGRFQAGLPPVAEQIAIVRFLDWTDRRIRRLIRARQRRIKLLEEYKQALIHQAVTGQIDVRTGQPYPVYKDSGVEWLGEVPAHWEIRRIGQIAKVGNGSTPSRANAAYWIGGSFPWLNSSSVHEGRIMASDQYVTEVALAECHLPIVRPGSVLVAITGQGKTRGTAALLDVKATINQHLAFITPMTLDVSPDYLVMFLNAAYPELRRLSDGAGGTKGALTCEDLRHFKVLIPPICEQHQVVNAVIEQVHSAELMISHTRREIDLIRELRTRLFGDVVTGKLDVREIAAHLPDEQHEDDAELIDEAEAADVTDSINEDELEIVSAEDDL
ncbi:MAG: restriction endonuclease subunit S [Caldilineaceae bacterium]|nr:restriction endonuclease subunit S [Caldilineaceae bacterium]